MLFKKLIFVFAFALYLLWANNASATMSQLEILREYGPERDFLQNNFILNPNESFGGMIQSFDIETPPGRNGMQPDLKLTYNNQNQEMDSAFGAGWSINIPYIQVLNKKGVESMYSDGYYLSSISGEIKPITTTTGETVYGAETDNGEFIKYELIDDTYWQAIDKNGVVYRFGYSAASRQDDSQNSAIVYKWMLDKKIDPNGNYIKYEYYKDNGQIYPYLVKYTGLGANEGIFEIEFLRESRTRNVLSYKTKFQVQTNYRISEIQTKINSSWVKKYEINYTTGDNGYKDMFSEIIESGKREDNTIDTWPAKSFTYKAKAKNWNYTAGNIPEPFVASLLSTASSYENFGKASIGNAIFEGVITAGTMGLTGMSSKVVGRHPNVGSINYYLGAHAQQSYLKGAAETTAAAVAGTIKTETQLIKNEKK